MDSRDVYRLALPIAYRILVFGMMAVMSVAGLFLVVFAVRDQGPSVVIMVPWCAALAWNWHVLLRIPYEIRFESANMIAFVALAGTTEVGLSDVQSITPYGGAGGLYILRHTRGKIRLLSQFTGFHEVISRLKAANPQLTIVGI